MMARHSSLPWKHQLEMPTVLYVCDNAVCVCVLGEGERRGGGRGEGEGELKRHVNSTRVEVFVLGMRGGMQCEK